MQLAVVLTGLIRAGRRNCTFEWTFRKRVQVGLDWQEFLMIGTESINGQLFGMSLGIHISVSTPQVCANKTFLDRS